MKWWIVAVGLFFDVVGFFLGLFFFAASVIPVLTPVAIPLGAGVDFAFSIIAGCVLILLLAINGMFYPMYILAAFFGESIPFINIFPGWTGLAYASVRKKAKKEQIKLQQQMQKQQEEEASIESSEVEELKVAAQNIDGIRQKNAA